MHYDCMQKHIRPNLLYYRLRIPPAVSRQTSEAITYPKRTYSNKDPFQGVEKVRMLLSILTGDCDQFNLTF